VIRDAELASAAPSTEFRLSTCGALLVCCGQIRAEFFPIFLETLRIDFSSTIGKSTGVVQVPDLQLSAVQHARLDGHAFRGPGGMNLLKAMSNLKSLIYTVAGYGVYFLEKDYARETPGGFDSWTLKAQIDREPNKLLGKCVCPEARDREGGKPYARNECYCSDNPIRKVIGVWEFLDRPFRLIAKVSLEDEVGREDEWVSLLRDVLGRIANDYVQSGYFDLGSKQMVVTKHNVYMGHFDVDLKEY
jgi:hypothetical protein